MWWYHINTIMISCSNSAISKFIRSPPQTGNTQNGFSAEFLLTHQHRQEISTTTTTAKCDVNHIQNVVRPITIVLFAVDQSRNVIICLQPIGGQQGCTRCRLLTFDFPTTFKGSPPGHDWIFYKETAHSVVSILITRLSLTIIIHKL